MRLGGRWGQTLVRLCWRGRARALALPLAARAGSRQAAGAKDPGRRARACAVESTAIGGLWRAACGVCCERLAWHAVRAASSADDEKRAWRVVYLAM
jgi:hypothetical protein